MNYNRSLPFHGGDTGSTPVRDANSFVSIFLEREGEGSPYLEAKIHLFESTKEVDSKGFYVLKNHTLVTFRFTCISLEYLKWFNHQNVLSHLDISEIEPEEK